MIANNQLIETEVTIGADPDYCYDDDNSYSVTASISERKNRRWRAQVCRMSVRDGVMDDDAIVVGRGDNLDGAVLDAKKLALTAKINPAYLAQALSQAADKAEEAISERFTPTVPAELTIVPPLQPE